MARYVFDIEANGFLETATAIHCIAITDIDTGEQTLFPPDKIEDGVRRLMQADLLVAHNGIKYDLPVIQKLYPWFTCKRSQVVDTLVLSRLVFTDLADVDFNAKAYKIPNRKLIGSHSLEAWGYRLGFNKINYEGGWEDYSDEMGGYCVGDTLVCLRLYNHILKQGVDPRASELEHEVQFIVAQQERYGFPFDVGKAERLAASLQSKLVSLENKVQQVFPPFYLPDGKITVPKRTTNGKKIAGTWAGASYQKIKKVIFNPGSRHHIVLMLKRKYNWKPTEFTEKGQPKVDEKVLSKLPWPEAKILAEWFMAAKILGYLIGNKKKKNEVSGWLNLVKDGRIYGECITNGAVTGRGTHKIIANIPKVGKPYGKEMRELFTASKGMRQVGADASGLELRMLAHFLAKWDNGAYGKVVCEGDVHWANVQALGLSQEDRDEDNLYHKLYRDAAKTFIYAFL